MIAVVAAKESSYDPVFSDWCFARSALVVGHLGSLV